MRKNFLKVKRRTVFALGGTAIGVLAVSGALMMHYSSALSSRIPHPAQHVLAAAAENIPWGGVCFQRTGDEDRYGGLCRIGNAATSASPTFVIWGDSHAEALIPLLNTLARAYDVQGVVFDAGNCIPILGVHQTPPAPGCEEEKLFAREFIKDNNIRQIVLVARWSYYLQEQQRGVKNSFITDSSRASLSPRDAEEVFARTLPPMLKELASEEREVYIVEQVPEQSAFDLRTIFYRTIATGVETPFESVSIKEHELRQAFSHTLFRTLTTLPHVHLINPATILCKEGGRCELEINGKLMYRDESHLSTIGAMSLEPLFTPMFTLQ